MVSIVWDDHIYRCLQFKLCWVKASRFWHENDPSLELFRKGDRTNRFDKWSVYRNRSETTDNCNNGTRGRLVPKMGFHSIAAVLLLTKSGGGKEWKVTLTSFFKNFLTACSWKPSLETLDDISAQRFLPAELLHILTATIQKVNLWEITRSPKGF